MRARSPFVFLAGLLIIDGAIAAAMLAPRLRTIGARPAAGAWARVDSAGLARGLLELERSARAASSDVELRLRAVGEDLELVASLGGRARYGERAYCPTCANQSCQFDARSLEALGALPRVFPRESLAAVAALVPGGRLPLTVVGRASAAEVAPRAELRRCQGGALVSFERPAATPDEYFESDCGSASCRVGERRQLLGAGPIDSPAELGCLRALCASRGLDAAASRELAGEEGAAGLELVVSLPGAAGEPTLLGKLQAAGVGGAAP